MKSTETGTSEISTEGILAGTMERLKGLTADPAVIEEMKRRERRERLNERYASGGFPDTLRSHTFETATFPEGAGSIAEIYDRLKRWSPRRGEQGILLMGNFGRGKSHLMHCVINRLVQNGMRYFHYYPFGRMIRNLWAYSSSYERERYWTNLCNAAHIFIDDLGRAPKAPRGGGVTWWVDLFFEFVDTHEVLKRPVFYTTNLDKKQLRQLLGGATVERLYANCEVIVLKGPNRRGVE